MKSQGHRHDRIASHSRLAGQGLCPAGIALIVHPAVDRDLLPRAQGQPQFGARRRQKVDGDLDDGVAAVTGSAPQRVHAAGAARHIDTAVVVHRVTRTGIGRIAAHRLGVVRQPHLHRRIAAVAAGAGEQYAALRTRRVKCLAVEEQVFTGTQRHVQTARRRREVANAHLDHRVATVAVGAGEDHAATAALLVKTLAGNLVHLPGTQCTAHRERARHPYADVYNFFVAAQTVAVKQVNARILPKAVARLQSRAAAVGRRVIRCPHRQVRTADTGEYHKITAPKRPGIVQAGRRQHAQGHRRRVLRTTDTVSDQVFDVVIARADTGRLHPVTDDRQARSQCGKLPPGITPAKQIKEQDLFTRTYTVHHPRARTDTADNLHLQHGRVAGTLPGRLQDMPETITRPTKSRRLEQRAAELPRHINIFKTPRRRMRP